MAKRKGGGTYKAVSVIILVVLIGAFLVGLGFENQIDERLKFRRVETFSKGDVVEVGSLTVHFMDVGQGDACLIELPDGKTVLIDAGDHTILTREKIKTYIADVNTARLHKDNMPQITYFDFLIITHSDRDHIGSLENILQTFSVKTFYRPNEEAVQSGYTDPANNGAEARNRFWGDHGKRTQNVSTYIAALDACYQTGGEGIVTNPSDSTQNKITPDRIAQTDSLYYEINFYGHSSSKYTDTNDYSPIIIIGYQGRRIALSGDCEQKGEAEFVSLAQEGLDRYDIFTDQFAVDIIKLGHHGSQTSSSNDYLSILSGANRQNVYLVISVGKNSYSSPLSPSHPHQEVIDRLKQLQFNMDRLLRTDQKTDLNPNGDIVFGLVLHKDLAGVVEDRAVIEVGGVIQPEPTYPIRLFDFEIRYRTIGMCIVVVAAALLLAPAFITSKKVQKRKR